MFSARWQIDAKFGQKQTVLELLKKWEREIGSQVGIADLEFQIMTGSIGTREATVESHHQVESLAQLEEFFARSARSTRTPSGARGWSPMSCVAPACGTYIALWSSGRQRSSPRERGGGERPAGGGSIDSACRLKRRTPVAIAGGYRQADEGRGASFGETCAAPHPALRATFSP
jgi:hypothetical protein